MKMVGVGFQNLLWQKEQRPQVFKSIFRWIISRDKFRKEKKRRDGDVFYKQCLHNLLSLRKMTKWWFAFIGLFPMKPKGEKLSRTQVAIQFSQCCLYSIAFALYKQDNWDYTLKKWHIQVKNAHFAISRAITEILISFALFLVFFYIHLPEVKIQN